MRILLLNKFTYPDPAPTARLLHELGEGLRTHGWEVEAISAGGNYRRGMGSGWRRWLKEGLAHLQLFWKALFAQRPDVLLCLSDPPGLVFTAALVARLRGLPLVHWVMDVYPQIAAALGEVSSTSPAYRLLARATGWGYTRSQLLAVLDADMASILQLQNDARLHVCPPWPSTQLQRSLIVAQEFIWLYSGNLGRAHEYELLLQVQGRLEERQIPATLVFQGRGPMMAEMMTRAAELDLQRCETRDYAEEKDLIPSLLRARILVASQKPATLGMIWPSKLALLKLLDRPLLWVAPSAGAISRMLRETHPSVGIFNPDEVDSAAQWVESQFQRNLQESSEESWSDKALTEYHAAVAKWHLRLSALVQN